MLPKTAEQKIKILLVEDEAIPRKIASILLEDIGCLSDAAPTGMKALELFEANDYDLILMDIGLPDLNGLQVAEKMRQSNNEKAKTPIVVVSAYSTDKYKEQAKLIGLEDFIVKPLTKEICETLVERFVLLCRMETPCN